MRILTRQELEPLLKQQQGWSFTENQLIREWTFDNFRNAMTFVNKVADLSELMDHHPDINIRFSRVRLALWSHDAGGITSRDTAMMARLNVEFD